MDETPSIQANPGLQSFSMKFYVLITFLIALITINAIATKTSNKRVLVWLCLEFCDETPEMIALDLIDIAKHRETISAVSFEKYTLGANSTLVDNHLTEVASKIQGLGLESWPLLSSFPHPPEFIDWMRQVFVNPKPFIDACISEAMLFGYPGYNLDWEPTDAVTAEDGTAYAQFIEDFAQGLHNANLKLTVDIATWSPIWNYTAIAATSVDQAISMGTYTSTDTSFTKQLASLTDAFGPLRSGVGLQTINASSGALIPLDEVKWRFDQIKASGAMEIDLWRLPVPPNWWPMLEEFVSV